MNGRDRPIERILVVKTSPADYCRKTLDRVGSLFPEARLTVWTEERESEEFYFRSDVERIVLYRNLLTIPGMVVELRAAHPDLVVVQLTSDPDYFKMHVFAAMFGGQSWLVFDRRGEVCGTGGFLLKLETITRSFFGNVNPIWVLIIGSLWLGRQLARVIAAPFVVLVLLVRAARHSVDRYWYLRRASRYAPKVRSDS